MSRRFQEVPPPEDAPASPAVTRLIILGFLVAAALGFLAGAGWLVLSYQRQ